MSFSPIAYTIPNYRDFKNYWLKAYEPSTTTPKAMALNGGAQVVKVELNKDGFPVSSGGALVIPYIEGAYDLWAFPTEEDADSNTTTNAERLADNITASISPDSLVISPYTLAEAKALTGAVVGQKVLITDRGNALFEYIPATENNEYNIIEAQGSGLSLSLILDGQIVLAEWGVDTTGVTPSDDAYNAITAYAVSVQRPINTNGETVNLALDNFMPAFGVTGDVTFTGAGMVEIKNNRKQYHSEGKTTFNSLNISGAQYATFNYLQPTSVGGLIIDGSDPDRGTFWNDFGLIDFGGGVLEIDTGQGQSINQNTFRQTRAGLHIFGGDGSGLEECDNNLFFGIDTTGADITDPNDLSTGWHLLNSSNLNQRNTVFGWYAEGSGRRAVKGNFNLISSYVDSPGNSPYAVERGNWIICNPDHSTRNQSDYIPVTPVNQIKGGSWDILDANGAGQPVGVGVSGGTVASVVADPTEPSGLGYKFGGVNTVDFRSINIPLTNNYHGRYTLCFWLQIVGGNPSAQTFRNGAPQAHSLDVAYEAPNNWKLFRFSVATRTDGVDDVLQLFFREPSTEMYISTIWGTPEKTAMLPYPANPEERIGVSNNGAVSNVPLALPVGGRIKNYDAGLSTGQVVEWVKRADNTAQPLLSMP